MRIIWDASILTMYPLGTPGFRGGTENMIGELVPRLAAKGHIVHVVTRDLEQEEQRGPNEFWWPSAYHPTTADVVIQTQQLVQEQLAQYQADKLVLMHTGCDPYLGNDGSWADGVDMWPVFSETHKQLLLSQRPTIAADRVHVVGLGVNMNDYVMYNGLVLHPDHAKVPGRMLYANDPMRGLFYVLDIFEIVKRHVPEASLHVAYDFDRQAAVHEWEHTYKAQLTLEMRKRMQELGAISLGALSKDQLIREQLECQVHCMPSDPPNIGTQTHGILQMECAAAGAALVLSDVEAFPEVFGEAATILPVIGYFDGQRRCDAQDYAGEVIALMTDPKQWQKASTKSRTLAAKHSWDKVADKWDAMLVGREVACA